MVKGWSKASDLNTFLKPKVGAKHDFLSFLKKGQTLVVLSLPLVTLRPGKSLWKSLQSQRVPANLQVNNFQKFSGVFHAGGGTRYNLMKWHISS